MSERPYSRVYWEVRADPRFVDIYSNNDHLATWLRLLIAADMAWPAPADVPASCRKASLSALCDVGLVELLPGQLYRVHGLDRERNERSDKARASVMHRYNDRATTVVRPKDNRTTSRAEPSLDEPSRPERADVEAYLATRFRLPTEAQRALMDTYCRVFDVTGPERAARLIYAHPDDPIGALKSDLATFREERRTEAVAQEAPKPPVHRPARGLTGINAVLAAEYNAAYAKERGES
jgi:hypothetical protein